MDDAANYLQKIEHREASGRMLNKMFGDDSEFYDPLFRFFFKKKNTETAQAVIKQINDLHDKKIESKAIVKLVDDLLEYASTVTAEESVSLKNAAGAILKKYGLDEKLKELADKFGSETIQLSLADLYAEKKEWVKARDSFKFAWDKDKSKSIIAFMIAKMEENIGDKEQASKWKDLASSWE